MSMVVPGEMLGLLDEFHAKAVFWRKGEIISQFKALAENASPDTWRKLCNDRFRITQERADQLVDSWRVISNLKASKTTAGVLPASESWCRPMAGLTADQQRLIWDWVVVNVPFQSITMDKVAVLAEQVKMNPNAPIVLVTPETDLPDYKFPSDNEFEIPNLPIEASAIGVPLPFELWTRGRKTPFNQGTWHFYTDDYRFASIWDDPTPIINSQCTAVTEPNFSIYDNVPRVVALYRIYLKRWLSRYWSGYGLQIFVDLNVSLQYAEDNLIGVPKGWRAYCTRGYSSRIEDLDAEFLLAAQRAGTPDILFVVYGGGAAVKKRCSECRWPWYPEQADVVREKPIVSGVARV